MPIAGVVILAEPEKTDEVLTRLNDTPNITTYGVHKENHIIAVFEAESSKGLEEISQQISRDIPGIQGIFPAYVSFEDE